MEATDIQQIHTKLVDLNNRLERFIELQQVHHDHIASIVQHHDRVIYGTNGGAPGLDKRLDRIETTSRLISKVSWSGLMAGLGALGTFLLGIFQWKD